MKKVLVTMPALDRHKQYLEEIGAGCQFRYVPILEVTREDVQDAQIILGNVPPAMLSGSRQLEWIQLNTAGSDSFCKEGIIRPGAYLTNATGAYGLAISEYMLGVSFMMQNKLALYHKNQLDHQWKSEGKVTSVWGSTVLVVGLGDIGSEYARKMKALGSYTIGIRRTAAEKPDYLDELYTAEKLDELLPRADFVALCLPNMPETNHIMDERRLRLMKLSAYLINVGRGNAIDSQALNRVLREGLLGGCAVDVTEPEPLPADDPLWDAPRMIITPHVAGKYNLPETLERIIRIAGENLKLYLAGKPEEMKNIVDFSTGYRRR